MGGAISKNEPEETKEAEISEKLDYIATYYILTSNFKSLKELYKKEYCDDLVILTSDIIQKHLNYQQISYLQSRIVNGDDTNAVKEEPAIFFSQNALQKDIKKSITNEKNKSRMCIGIAKFYIKIAHIFAAIITSVNPLYSYVEDGEEKQVGGSEKNDIPDGSRVRISKGSLCQRRLEALSSGYEYINATDKTEAEIRIGANLCEFKSKDSLVEEPGIPELEELYYDKYDFEEGKFYAMTDKSRQMYENDVKGFYEIFMNTDEVPETIRKFSDIKLKDFKTMKECQGDEPLFKRTFKDSPKNALFFEYSENIKRMIKNTEENQDALLDIINDIFVYTIDPDTGDKLVRIDPLLTMGKLEEIIINTRSLLIKLYLTCETDFNEGVRVFKSIADKMTVYKMRNEIDELEKSESIQEYLKSSNERYKNAVTDSFSEPPSEMREPLSEMSEPPSEMGERHSEMSEPPSEMSEPPSEMGERHSEMSEPPSEMGERPSEMDEPPSEMGERPSEMGEPPSEMGERPGEMGEPPSEMSEPPNEMGEPPSEMREPPSEMSEPPSEMSEPPSEMGERPSEMSDPKMSELSNSDESKVVAQPSPDYPLINLNSGLSDIPKDSLDKSLQDGDYSESLYDAPFNETNAKGNENQEILELRKEIELLKLKNQELQNLKLSEEPQYNSQMSKIDPPKLPQDAKIEYQNQPINQSQADVPLMGGIKLNKLISKYVR